MTRRARALSLGAATALALTSLTVIGAPAASAALPDPFSYSGYAAGTGTYLGVISSPGLAQVGLAHSAAGVGMGPGVRPPLTDTLKQPLTSAGFPAAKTAFGHGASANVGAFRSPADQPLLQGAVADAQSPAKMSASDSLLSTPAPLSPVLTATLLPSTALANTTAGEICPPGGAPISQGVGRVAEATVLNSLLASAPGEASTTSLTQLADNPGLATKGLIGQSTVTIAPVTLFGQLTITVLAPLRLQVKATGVGAGTVEWAPVGKGPTDPVLTISSLGGTQTQTLTTQDVFGPQGLTLALGAVDVVIGAPPHALGGLEGTSPLTTTTLASAAADVIRITGLPGLITPPSTPVTGGPLGQLNPVLTPVLAGAAPITSVLQTVGRALGFQTFDLRLGHAEASVEVPAGGIQCSRAVTPPPPPADTTNPFPENVKDVSAIQATPGQTFDYTVRFPNRASKPVTNAVVTDTFSSALELVSSTPPVTRRNGNVLTFEIGTVAPNAVATVTLTFRVPKDAKAGTKYANDATITGTYEGRTVDGAVHVDGPTVKAPFDQGRCILTYSKMYSSNKEVVPGEDFNYFVNVLNSGDIDCKDVVITQKLPAGVTFVSCSQPCSFKDGVVSWQVGTVKPGESKVVSVTVTTVATSGALPGDAVISASNSPDVKVHTPDPVVTGRSVASPGNPAGCTSSCPTKKKAPVAPAKKELAYTGTSPLPAALAGVLLLAALVIDRSRRRRATWTMI